MNNKNISLIAFIALAIIQLAIPSWMMLHREGIKSGGKEYRFKCRPIDPNDPFRGKYVTLGFDAEDVLLSTTTNNNWKYGDLAYALLSKDADGYAIVTDLKQNPPTSGDFIQVYLNGSVFEKRVRIRFPFNRYYMEESKAPKAERLYWESLQTAEVVALVNVRNGDAVLKKVLIDGVPIEDAVERMAN